MKVTFLVAAVLVQASISAAQAQQAPATDANKARLERRSEAVAAAHAPNIGEGNTIPDARPKVSPADRAQARAARRIEGAKAARASKPGEGNPIPEARAKVSPEERAAARQVRRTQAAQAQKDGTIRAMDESKY